MADLDLDTIKAAHHDTAYTARGPVCARCHERTPCTTVQLLAEVILLRREVDRLRGACVPTEAR